MASSDDPSSSTSTDSTMADVLQPMPDELLLMDDEFLPMASLDGASSSTSIDPRSFPSFAFAAGASSSSIGGEDDGYRYHPGYSMYAILSFATAIRIGRVLNCFPLRGLTPPPHTPPVFSHHLITCTVSSASRGKVLFRNLAAPTATATKYFISNPLCLAPDATYVRLPNPKNHHAADVPALVSAFHPVGTVHDYIIICLRSQMMDPNSGRQRNMVDMFHSSNRTWRSTTCTLDHPVHIDPNTGVAIEDKAYWLTTTTAEEEEPLRLVRFDVGRGTTVLADTLDVPPGARRQLGRIRDKLCCVCVDDSCLALHVLGDDDRWQLKHRVPMTVSEGAEFRYDGESVSCRVMPVPARFESYKLEVVFWVDGRLVLWENRCFFSGKKGDSPGDWEDDKAYRINVVPESTCTMDWVLQTVPIVVMSSTSPT